MRQKQNPMAFYLNMLLYMFLALLMRLAAFAPLVSLFVFEQDSSWRYLALLCPALLVFFVLPLRFSFAEALVQEPGQRRFSLSRAFGFRMYGEKLAESILHAVNLIKWGIPLAAMLVYGFLYYQSTDAFTVLAAVRVLGQRSVEIWNSIANFFIELFGGTNPLTYTGDLGEGIAMLAGLLGLGILIWLCGMVRNSTTRYIWVLATHADRSPRVEIRRRLIGRRFRQLMVALLNLVLWAPFAVLAYLTVKDIIPSILNNLLTIVMSDGLSRYDFSNIWKPLALIFLCLYMPILPIRRYITAAFAVHGTQYRKPGKPVEHTSEKPADYKPNVPQLFGDFNAQSKNIEISKPAVFSAASEPHAEAAPMDDSRAMGETYNGGEQTYSRRSSGMPEKRTERFASNDPTAFTIGQ